MVVPDRAPFVEFPRETQGWSGSRKALDPATEAALGADDYTTMEFVQAGTGAAAPVDFFAAYYHKETDGGYIHSPAACLPAGGWEVFRIEPVDIALPGTQFGDIRLNRTIIQKGLSKQLVYFWFEGRGRSIANDFEAKIQTVADSLLRGRRDVGIVRLITPIGEAESERAADARLTDFLAAHADHLHQFFPK